MYTTDVHHTFAAAWRIGESSLRGSTWSVWWELASYAPDVLDMARSKLNAWLDVTLADGVLLLPEGDPLGEVLDDETAILYVQPTPAHVARLIYETTHQLVSTEARWLRAVRVETLGLAVTYRPGEAPAVGGRPVPTTAASTP